MVSFSLGEDHRQKSGIRGQSNETFKGSQQRTINGVDDEGLAQGILVLRGGVAAVVADLISTDVANGLNLVRLDGDRSQGPVTTHGRRQRTRAE